MTYPSLLQDERHTFALQRDITHDDAIDTLFAGLLGDKRQAEFFAHHRCQKAADRPTPCRAGQSVPTS